MWCIFGLRCRGGRRRWAFGPPPERPDKVGPLAGRRRRRRPARPPHTLPHTPPHISVPLPMPTTVTLRGTPLALYGTPLKPGDYAPEAFLITSKLEELIVGGSKGKPQILITVPSLDTPVCATEAQKFNQALAAYGDKILAAVISMDLPFAQSRYCQSYQVEGLIIASDYRFRDMARYGVVVAEGPLRGILARAVFVVDPTGKITYTELVPEIGQEPNYDAALSALRALL